MCLLGCNIKYIVILKEKLKYEEILRTLHVKLENNQIHIWYPNLKEQGIEEYIKYTYDFVWCNLSTKVHK